jgi:hypothetical protein
MFKLVMNAMFKKDLQAINKDAFIRGVFLTVSSASLFNIKKGLMFKIKREKLKFDKKLILSMAGGHR